PGDGLGDFRLDRPGHRFAVDELRRHGRGFYHNCYDSAPMKRLLIALALFTVAASEPPKGTICFSGAANDCVSTTGMTFEVKPADTERRWVWTSADGANVVLGVIAAKATSVDLESKDAALRTVTLSLHGDARRGWPSDARFMLASGKDRNWR